MPESKLPDSSFRNIRKSSVGVRLEMPVPSSASAGAFQCHRAPDGGMDGTTTDRGVRAGREPSAYDPGPGSGLWRTIFASSPAVGHLGGGHCATLAVAKRLCGARDWLDSAGMPWPCRSSRRAASAGDPVEVRRLLQSDPDTLIAGEGRAGVAECAATEPGPGGGSATRRWASSRILAAGGVSRSDQ